MTLFGDHVRVLLIDDDEDDFVITREALEDAVYTHFQMDWVDNFAAGKAQIASENHDVYLVDLHLGEQDGFELLRFAEERGCQKPLILLTGQGEKEFDLQALSLGAMDFLVKGQFTAAMLERSIVYALRHKQTLIDLRERESQLSDVLESQSELICRFDRENVLTFVNGAFARYFGEAASELLGQTYLYLLPEDAQEMVRSIIHRTFQTNKTITFEVSLPQADGSLIWQEWTTQPIVNIAGETLEVQAVAIDITDRKTAELTLRNALAREKELGELKSRFVSMASHEFRTPLTTIMSTASYLEIADAKIDSDKRVTRLTKIQHAAKGMAQLLDEVLLFGKADANRLEFIPEEIDLVSFIKEIIEDISAGSGRSHTINFDHTSCSEPFIGDIKLMRQILSNLITNAIKYSPKGSLVTISLDCDETQYRLKVHDQGIGIPETDQPHIFTPFHRARNTRDYSGTGLGLAITHSAVTRHQGQISFASVVKQGTVFTVVLPKKLEIKL